MNPTRTTNTLPLMLAADTLKKISREMLIEQVGQLQDALVSQDRLILEMRASLTGMSTLNHDLGARLYALVDAFDENDRNAIALQLRQMSDRRKPFKKPEVH